MTPPERSAPSVLHVVSSDAYAGIERHVVRLTSALRAKGCAAEIACPPSAIQLRDAAAAEGIPLRPRSSRRRGGWPLAVAQRLAGAPLDLIHVHDGGAAVIGGALARLYGRSTVRTQHFVSPASAERVGWQGRGSLALHRALNRRLGAYIAVSGSVAAAARTRNETGAAEVVVIPPGIEPPDEEALRRASDERATIDAPVVASIGRLEAEKRVDLLLAAVPQVLEIVPACRFVIAGAGSRQQDLRLLALRLGIQRAVTWAGEVNEPTALLRSAHVYVNPSPAEGFGLATVEAMALGLPVVAVAAGASAEIVVDGETGLLVPPDDPGALAEAIARLAADRDLAARIGLAAHRRAVSLYGIERTAERTLSLYRHMLTHART